jgi:hypothetical protein
MIAIIAAAVNRTDAVLNPDLVIVIPPYESLMSFDANYTEHPAKDNETSQNVPLYNQAPEKREGTSV